MKATEILSSTNLRTLRNGKTITPGKNAIAKKKSILKLKSDVQFVFPKTSRSDYSILIDENKNNSHASAYDRLLGIRELYICLEKLSWPLINDIKVTIRDQNNNNTNVAWCKSLEDYNILNEQNNQEQKKETKSEIAETKTFLPTAISPTKTNSVINQNTDVRITRGMTTKLETEEREQVNQRVIDKFPDITFKMCSVKLDNISEKSQFLRTLGLTCRFKNALNTFKLKRKH